MSDTVFSCSCCHLILIAVLSLFLLTYFIRKNKHSVTLPKPDLSNKVFVVTGASDGVGKEAAKYFLLHGATVVYACRSRTKTEKVIASLEEKIRKNAHLIECDLSDYSSVEKFVEAFNKKFDRLDCLLNNAGLWQPKRELTKNGHEVTLQANHLGHFLLTDNLYDKINNSNGRIVNVSSRKHKSHAFPEEYFESKEGYWDDLEVGEAVYGWTKGLNVLFTRYLAMVKKSRKNNVYSYSLHPGVVRTNIELRHATWYEFFVYFLLSFPHRWWTLKNVEEGSYTSIYCCLESPASLVNSSYYADCKEAEVNPQMLDEEILVKAINFTIDKIEQAGFRCKTFKRI